MNEYELIRFELGSRVAFSLINSGKFVPWEFIKDEYKPSAQKA